MHHQLEGIHTQNVKPPLACSINSVVPLVLILSALWATSIGHAASGNVAAWGDNSYGQTTVPPGLTNVVAVAAGAYHSLVLKADGTVVAWGAGTINNASDTVNYGQSLVPPGLSNVVAIAAGMDHSLAVRSDGTVISWGKNDWGETNVPAGLSNVVAVAGGAFHSLALKRDGTVVAWGGFFFHQTQVPQGLSNVVAISAGGGSSSLALKSDGTVVAWGEHPNVPAGLSNVVEIAASEYYNLALRSDGTVVAWGSQIPGSEDLTNAVAIAAGWHSSLALTDDGSLLGWGDNSSGQTNIPPGLSNVVGIAAGFSHCLAIVDAPPVVRWQSGNQDLFSGMNNVFRVIAVGTPLAYQWQFNGTNIEGATNASLFLSNVQTSDTGSYRAVMTNSLGAETSSNMTLTVVDSIPIIVAAPANQTILAGTNAALTLTVDGSAPVSFQWQLNGTNVDGATNSTLMLTNVQPNQAGSYSVVVSNRFGSLTSSSADLNVLPLSINSQPKSQFVLSGATTSFSVTVSGEGPFSYQWQFQGVAIAGATNSTVVLANVQPAQSGLYSVAVSNIFGSATSTNASLVVKDVLVWGDNTYGETNVPVSATNVIELAAGDYHCLGLRRDGTVVAWGKDTAGQTDVPPDLTNAVAVATGSTHSLALRADGTMTMWGKVYWSGVSNVPPEATNIVALAQGPGAVHALVLRADGSVFDWGGYSDTADIPPTVRGIVQVASGSYFGLALRSDGKVVTWGQQSWATPAVPASATNIVAIAAGWYDAAALRDDGTVICWGQVSQPPPLPPAGGFAFFGFTNVVSLACPFNSILDNGSLLGLRRDGTLVEWPPPGPQSSVLASPTNIAAIGAGGHDALAVVGSGPPVFPGLAVNRTVTGGARAYFRWNAVGALPLFYQWSCNGTNIPNATNSVLVVTNVQPNQAGNSYAVTASNAYGTNTSGAMMLNVIPLEAYIQATDLEAVVEEPVSLTAVAGSQGPFSYQWRLNGTNLLGETSATLTLANAQLADAGAYSVIVSNVFGLLTNTVVLTVTPTLTTNAPQSQTIFPGGTVTFSIGLKSIIPVTYEWQFDGVRIDGETNNTLTLANVNSSRGGTYAVVIRDAFETVTNRVTLSLVSVAAWGDRGQEVVPPSATNLIAVASGDLHALGLRADGTVIGWGLGAAATVPIGLSNVVSVSAGNDISLALKEDGTIVSWGRNYVVPTDATNVVAISAGSGHSLALKSDGTVIAWGGGSSGETNVPSGLTGAVAVAAGQATSMALKADGTVVAWGDNSYSSQSTVPPGLTAVVQIANGGDHELAFKSDGTIAGWGDNSHGQTTQPASVSNVVAISAGFLHSVALEADGTVAVWGSNSFGETNVPPGLSNVVAISAQGFHTVALVGNGPPVVRAPLSNPVLTTNGFSVSLPTQSGRVYRLEFKNSLADANWTPLPLVAGNGGMLTLTDPGVARSTRFYRVRTW